MLESLFFAGSPGKAVSGVTIADGEMRFVGLRRHGESRSLRRDGGYFDATFGRTGSF